MIASASPWARGHCGAAEGEKEDEAGVQQEKDALGREVHRKDAKEGAGVVEVVVVKKSPRTLSDD